LPIRIPIEKGRLTKYDYSTKLPTEKRREVETTKLGKYIVRVGDRFVFAPIDEENEEEMNIDWTWDQIDRVLAESKVIRRWEPEEGACSVFWAEHPELGNIVCTKQEEGQDVCITSYGDSGKARQLFGETKMDCKQGRVYWE